VEDLLAEGVENGTSELHPRKYSVVKSDQTYCGEIQVGVTFTKKVLLNLLSCDIYIYIYIAAGCFVYNTVTFSFVGFCR